MRKAYAIVFFWFGALKLVPGADPSAPLAHRVLPVEPFTPLYAVLGLLEMFIAVGLLYRPLRQFAAAFSVMLLTGFTVPLVACNDIMFSSFPIVLTLDGQYLLKNLVFLGAALVLLVDADGRSLSHRSSNVRNPLPQEEVAAVTVKGHPNSVSGKLGTNSRTQAVARPQPAPGPKNQLGSTSFDTRQLGRITPGRHQFRHRSAHTIQTLERTDQ